ncbi:hypothetical protein KO561_17150 [Radiobacillus kanasensis]|uniref:anti-sigma-I factor RsgI family protein n=1 Tax=Radiobacillus kanasensis TaxID=2844358 RepID=UPI001E4FD41B|nr:hypothetical protein [Radiobacillus kanasensis]UFT98899.1 hypothetical protein KO561_17150 [Radiobacillus kanasensis]
MKKHTIEGIVTKVTENEYVLLCDDGTFKNIARNESDLPMMGERVTYSAKSNPNPFPFKVVVSTIAMVAVLFIAFFSYGMLNVHSETHYIATIDINPSIEAHLDQDLNVVKLSPLNTDGEKIVDSIESKDLNIYQVVNLIVSEAISKGYLTEEEKGRIETTIVKVKDNGQKPSEQDITEGIRSQLQHQNIVADVKIFNETKEFYDQAERVHVSVNKYRHYKALKERGLVQNIEEVKDKSVRQLEDMMAEDVTEEQGKMGQGDSTKDNSKLNSESGQGQEKPQPNKDSEEDNPSLDDRQESPINKGVPQKGRDTKKQDETPTNSNSLKNNPTSSDSGNSRNEGANNMTEREGNQTNTEENIPEQIPSAENQPKKESAVEEENEPSSKSEPQREDRNLGSVDNKGNEQQPSSTTKP